MHLIITLHVSLNFSLLGIKVVDSWFLSLKRDVYVAVLCAEDEWSHWESLWTFVLVTQTGVEKSLRLTYLWGIMVYWYIGIILIDVYDMIWCVVYWVLWMIMIYLQFFLPRNSSLYAHDEHSSKNCIQRLINLRNLNYHNHKWLIVVCWGPV